MTFLLPSFWKVTRKCCQHQICLNYILLLMLCFGGLFSFFSWILYISIFKLHCDKKWQFVNWNIHYSVSNNSLKYVWIFGIIWWKIRGYSFGKKVFINRVLYHLVLSMNVAILLVESKMMVGSFRQNCWNPWKERIIRFTITIHGSIWLLYEWNGQNNRHQVLM